MPFCRAKSAVGAASANAAAWDGGAIGPTIEKLQATAAAPTTAVRTDFLAAPNRMRTNAPAVGAAIQTTRANEDAEEVANVVGVAGDPRISGEDRPAANRERNREGQS